ncbi:hypothetical protein [Pontiella sulfatireligans]|uniref:Uncharacterized protein n=1 Tax=Pontiella sulfatireligans TaxID=2750658 RepID=A0A6C2UDH9_9BACT|nr:hypothetical protein [Pontiella sulfatireligans]VGO18248.1 hypothetical protein SCARR_00300 [Pontiella sulfatireligans]
MKKVCIVSLAAIWLAGGVGAETVVFQTNSEFPTTGEFIEGAFDEAITTNVAEIAGLLVSARTGSTNHQINANGYSLGINNKLTPVDAEERFEAGESLFLSFSKDVEISKLDFRNFELDETFTLSVQGKAAVVILGSSLDNLSQDYIWTNISVGAHTDIEFYTTEDGEIGLDSMDLTVAEGTDELILSFGSSNGVSQIAVDLNGAAATNYVLQRCDDLASNDWKRVSTFWTDTNWVVEATNNSGFYRAVVD